MLRRKLWEIVCGFRFSKLLEQLGSPKTSCRANASENGELLRSLLVGGSRVPAVALLLILDRNLVNYRQFNEAHPCHHITQGAHVPDVIPLQGNLLDAEYRTDDFRINHFKVCVLY